LQRSRWGAAVAAPRSRGLLSADVLLLLLVLLLLVVGLGAAHVHLIFLFFLLAGAGSPAKDIAVPRPNVRNAASAMKLA